MITLRKCPARSTARAAVLVRDIFKKYREEALREGGLTIGPIVQECMRLNPSLAPQEVYEAITAVGPSDREVQEYDNAQH